jgi:hypothetical protein
MCVLTCRCPDAVREVNSVRSTCRSRNFLQHAAACGAVLCKSIGKDCKDMSIRTLYVPHSALRCCTLPSSVVPPIPAPTGTSQCNRASTSPQLQTLYHAVISATRPHGPRAASRRRPFGMSKQLLQALPCEACQLRGSKPQRRGTRTSRMHTCGNET